jgi:hypothetical protein
MQYVPVIIQLFAVGGNFWMSLPKITTKSFTASRVHSDAGALRDTAWRSSWHMQMLDESVPCMQEEPGFEIRRFLLLTIIRGHMRDQAIAIICFYGTK